MAKFIRTNFSGESDAVFAQLVDNTIAGMDGNTDFPNPPHSIAILQTKLASFRLLCKDRSELSTVQRDERKALRSEIQLMLTGNGVFVVSLFMTNKAKQLSSGYPPVKERNSDGVANKPNGLKILQDLQTGEVRFSFKGSYNARSYLICWRVANSTDTFQFLSTGKTVANVITGLVSGVNYEFTVKAIGAKQDSVMAGPVYFRPQ